MAMHLPCPLYDGDGKGERSVITPFFLGKTCRDWRDLVWSSPLLWTNIHLCITRRTCKAQANLLRDWLSRTASCPHFFALPAEKSLRSGTTIPRWKFQPSLPPSRSGGSKLNSTFPITSFGPTPSLLPKIHCPSLPPRPSNLTRNQVQMKNSLSNYFQQLLNVHPRSAQRVYNERCWRLRATRPQLSALHLY